jgi:glycosyltransferase involved in cell wall biosynthesis
MTSAVDRVGLSLIICTYNRATLLDQLLQSIERELTDRLDLEVIVVDNNCIDDTAEVVRRYEGRLPELSRVVETNQGLSFARNRGAAKATKEYLLYLDDETTLSEAFLDRAELVLRRFRPDFFGGPTIPHCDQSVPDWFDLTDEIRQFERFSGFSPSGSVSGANFGVRRAVLERLGPFDMDMGMKGDTMAFGEDREMVERYRSSTPLAQQRVYYAVELTVHNFIMHYKIDRKYQLMRAYKNTISREHIVIGTGKRGLARSIVYGFYHVVLLPFHVLLIILDHGLTARGYYRLVLHLFTLAGRLRGILEVTLARLIKRTV